jgi:hypothetical protein
MSGDESFCPMTIFVRLIFGLALTANLAAFVAWGSAVNIISFVACAGIWCMTEIAVRMN